MTRALRRHLFASLLAMAAAGCTANEPPPLPPPRATAPEADRTLERAVQEPLQQARAVEEQMRAARKAQDQRLEDGGG